jgi:hypothetical protein
MPVFTFEKISAPVRRGPTATTPKKPRGVIGQMIDRVTELRTRRALREQPSRPRRDEKAAE